MDKTPVSLTAGGAIFSTLKALGVDYVFANSGTDFPPVIEGLAEAAAKGIALPRALVIPHEHAAMGMAHGFYLVTGKSQAVMLHTNVGLSNGATGAINAACENIPVLIMSGRTPVTEGERFGARTVPIAWGQEMRDQAALIRESCKWEYELRFAEQVGPLLDRAYAIANSTPKGPVYLSLPREVLCETVASQALQTVPTLAPSRAAPDPESIEIAAQWIAEAKSPLVIAQRGCGSDSAFETFSRWSQEWAVAVSSWWATHLAISTEHPCHIGSDPGRWLAKADVVVILNSLAPWWPDKHALNAKARVINIGPDPLFSRFPVRNFRSDLSIASEVSTAITALAAAMPASSKRSKPLASRRKSLAKASAAVRDQLRISARADITRGITKAYVSDCLGEALQGMHSTVFSELGTQLGSLRREEHLSWFQEPHSGGLGWSFPAALGARLGDPGRLCVATMGDGSYMFANPTVCHQIAESLDLAILVIVLNNREWGAVRASVKGLYPDGYAASANQMPLTALTPSPDFTQTAKASRAWTRKVTDAGELPGVLREAIDIVTAKNNHALVEIETLPD